MTETTVGIHDLSFATSHHVLDLGELAAARGIDPDKYYVGIGQNQMSVLAEDEDIVTMAAEAAQRVIERNGVEGIRTLLFATESGIDQSKAAGVYVHRLLGLSPHCRVVELKQACYSATAALQFALGIVSRSPEERVLIVASDVARYELESSGEPTQGAGAAAILVTAEPDLVAIEPVTGTFTQDIHDFWRPNYRSEAIVDGKFSMIAYLESLEESWRDFQERGGAPFEDIERFCYHQPFTKMAVKAQERMQSIAGQPAVREAFLRLVSSSFEFNRRLGNTYTASMYLGLLSMLNFDPEDLGGRRIGFFSYGSGSVGEFFSGVVQPGYRELLRIEADEAQLSRRVPLGYAEYRELHERLERTDGLQFSNASLTRAPFRFAGTTEHMRQYEPRGANAPAD